MNLQDVQVGDKIDGFYLLQTGVAKVTAAGKPFFTLTLADATGTLDGQVWDYTGPITPKDAGAVVKIRGTVSEYRGAKQINVERIRLAVEGDPYQVETLVPVAPLDANRAWKGILQLVDSLEDDDYAAVCREMLRQYGEQFRRIPAAKSVHHGFLNGLLMHTWFMLQMADSMAGLYAEVIDRSLLLSGTLLHDFAKCREFTLSPLGLVTDYSVAGNLLGHLVMGAQWVAQAAQKTGIPEEKSVLLQHMILSHHGEPEFGAAVRPQCAESELLSFLDMIDSRMEIYRETLPEVPEGEFSKRIFALDRKIYHHH